MAARSRRRVPVEAGPVSDVLERPKAPYTIRLMEDVPKLAANASAG